MGSSHTLTSLGLKDSLFLAVAVAVCQGGPFGRYAPVQTGWPPICSLAGQRQAEGVRGRSVLGHPGVNGSLHEQLSCRHSLAKISSLFHGF